MKSALQQLIRVTIGALILLPSVVAVQTIVTSGPAEARCAGVNSYVTSTYVLSGTEMVREYPKWGSCNNNNLYTGYLVASRPGMAEVYIQNNGSWSRVATCVYGHVCEYSYRDDNSNTYMRLCHYFDGSRWCGWGTSSSPDAKGRNHGY